jgi:phosphoribosylglycinamide formyltransferase-1
VDARVAVLASGTGSNLQALLDDPRVGPCIVLVVSDRPDAIALERAGRRGVKTAVLQPKAFASRADHDRALLETLTTEGIEFVLSAGYLRIVGPGPLRAYASRWLNIHPSLLPAFPGMHAERQVLDWGAKITGVTVHIVDEEVDHGPIVLQEAVAVLEGDDEETLHRRIQQVEHRLYPQAARLLIEGRLKVEGRLIHIIDEDGDKEGSG